MKTLRNILLFAIVMTLVFAIASCGSNKEPDATVATTTEPIIAITTSAPTVTTTTGSEIVATTTTVAVTTTVTEPPVTTTLAPITSRTLTPPTDIELNTPATTYFKLTIQVPVAIPDDKVKVLEISEDQLGFGDLILVNSNHAIIDEDALKGELKDISSNRAKYEGVGAYGLVNTQMQATESAINALNELILAYKESGGTLYPVITVAHRTSEQQEE